jgi:hypothetical protein
MVDYLYDLMTFMVDVSLDEYFFRVTFVVVVPSFLRFMSMVASKVTDDVKSPAWGKGIGNV